MHGAPIESLITSLLKEAGINGEEFFDLTNGQLKSDVSLQDLREHPEFIYLFELSGLMDSLVDRKESGNSLDAGYTYLGQFIDHDILYSNNSCMINGQPVGRCPDIYGKSENLDLSCVYGGFDAEEEFNGRLDCGKLPIKHNDGKPIDIARQETEGGRPVISDSRNDENLLVSQLHLLFSRAHNALCDVIDEANPYINAKAELIACYQRIVKHDYLQKILHSEIYKLVDEDTKVSSSNPFENEFSLGAFRFGHSMVKSSYIINKGKHFNTVINQSTMFDYTFAGQFRGHANMSVPRDFAVDWSMFFSCDGYSAINKARELSPSTVIRLPKEAQYEYFTLTTRNLLRGYLDKASTFNDLLTKLSENNYSANIKLLINDVSSQLSTILNIYLNTRTYKLSDDVKGKILEHCPLWFGVLCEASFYNSVSRKEETLGPAASIIIYEKFAPLLKGETDPQNTVLENVNTIHGLLAWVNTKEKTLENK